MEIMCTRLVGIHATKIFQDVQARVKQKCVKDRGISSILNCWQRCH